MPFVQARHSSYKTGESRQLNTAAKSGGLLNSKTNKNDMPKFVSYFERFKAQVIDTFMIYTPILYITTYFVLDGAQEFRESEIAHFIAVFIYGILASLFISLSAQTPGCKAQGIAIVDTNLKKINFLKSLVRFFLYLITVFLIWGVFLPQIRRQKTTIHDIICGTQMIYKHK